MMSSRIFLTLLAIFSFSPSAFTQIADQDSFGHSAHGVAFDTGLRQKPWKMQGIGSAHFQITTKVPEVQEWFDQGNALLHSFWYEEAERTFRWCVKLDPDCAMGYWGLAVTGFNWSNMGGRYGKTYDRYRDFLKEAVNRKFLVSERERMFIEAWDEAYDRNNRNTGGTLSKKLQAIVKAYPDDIEAKAYAALFSIGSTSAEKNDALLQLVLAVNPDHPGAHHYRIHNWDFPDPARGLDSCQRYGQVAPAIGHAMHMPGHIFSKVGMWHEAALAMDGATRVELKYMNNRLALPFEAWNFAHNRTYLSYIQEQLGMANAAIQGARDLIEAPMDPQYNNFESFDTGLNALVRALVKFERWEEILKPGSVPWRKSAQEDSNRAACEGMACCALGKINEARKLLSMAAKKKADEAILESEYANLNGDARCLAGLILVGEHRVDEGLKLIKSLADDEMNRFKNAKHSFGDPPDDPISFDRVYADLLLSLGRAEESIPYYEAQLHILDNDGFSLSGLARAYAASGNRYRATQYAGKLMYVWSGADPGLKWIDSVKALKLGEQPIADVPFKERIYRPDDLDRLGPSNWRPYAAPRLSVTDTNGKNVKLTDFKGKNVVLVFYLSDECVHCVEQLHKLDTHKADFSQENTVVLGVSNATPKQNRESLKLGGMGIKLLSDTNHNNARAFASYDDFEDMELHSTIIIDKEGKVRWKRTGGEPFSDVDWLLKEIKRINTLPD